MRVLTTTTTASTTAASCSSLPSGDYEFSAAKAKAAKDAVDRRRHEEGKRRAYEERMARKAKREGRPPDYYLQKGEDMDRCAGWMGCDGTTTRCLDGAGGVDDTSLLFDDNLMTISTTTRCPSIHPPHHPC